MREHAYAVAPNVLAREFTASAPNRKWLADLTYVPTAEGWLYVALVLDAFSRKLVGWALSDSLGHELTVEALQMALGWRIRRQAWCITRTAGCSTRRTTTAGCWPRVASPYR
jgi:transposase InsO family protein